MSRLAWAAGEASGDLIAAPVVARLGARVADAQQAGIGGPAMAAAGLDCWVGIDQLSVRGYAEVLLELPRLLRLRRDLGRRLLQWQPAVFVGVDAPDFNLGLAQRLRRGGVRTMHFVGPSVWAWRAKRLERIRACVDHMLLVFPFEKPLYDAAGIPATYVGHPLADAIDPASLTTAGTRAQLGLPAEGPLLCLMPGSRGSEIHYMGDLFVDTVRWLLQARPELRFVMPAANAELERALRSRLGSLDHELGGPVELLLGRSHEAIAAADAVLVASGTATLEVALLRKPMVITYRMSPLSYRWMRRMALQPWIGLPNILCQETVVPEILQDEATPAALGRSLLQLLEPSESERIATRFATLRASMAIGCAQRAAQAIEAQLSR
ncbi:MAG: lipid-A-disaccharide synthase [Burkholderiaceae bacterium]